MNRRRALGLLVGAGAVACSRRTPAVGVASRVVSLSPSTTEAMFAIGAGTKLVGRSRFCDFPPEVASLPQVGGYVDPSFEAIFALRPDLVVGARGPLGPSIAQRIEARGVATYFAETESVAQIGEMIVGIGERVGATTARAVVDGIRARLARVARAVAGKATPRVLFVVGLEPIVACGPGTFADELLRLAGAVNAVRDGTGWPTLGMEHVIALDPDLVLNAAIAEGHGAQRIGTSTAGWSSMRAVKSGAVVAIADETVLRPGPRVPDALERLTLAIHPDVVLE